MLLWLFILGVTTRVGLISLLLIQIYEISIFEILRIDNKTKLHNRGRARYILMILTDRKISFVFITFKPQ